MALRRLSQGEDYQEPTPENNDNANESSSVSKDDGGNNKPGMPQNMKMLVAILACISVLFIAVILVIVGKKGGFSKEESPSSDEGQITDSDDDLFNQLMANAEQGEVINTEEPQESADTDFNFDDEYSESSYGYSDEEAITLRKYGYTGDEIEWSRSNGISYESMIAAADEAHNELAKEKIKEMGDTGSKEYKRLLNMTWLGGDELELQEVLPDDTGNYNIWSTTKVINGDYTKCGQQGRQLFIRIKTEDYGNIFMTVTPKRWMQLNDKGNIVVEVTVDHYNDQEVVTYVTEVDTGDHPDEVESDNYSGNSLGDDW